MVKNPFIEIERIERTWLTAHLYRKFDKYFHETRPPMKVFEHLIGGLFIMKTFT
ncbi:hypothetical protein NTPn38_03880 [Streptococcus pneumoniae]|nr:hypothetical protein NTPn38_03880 [Streptococcus pneumoniae]